MLLRLWMRGIIRIRFSTVKLLWAVMNGVGGAMVGRGLRGETVFRTVAVGRR